MGLFSRETDTATVSLVERYNAAQANHASAMTIFLDASEQLNEAAELYESVVREAQEEIKRLTYVRDEALQASVNARQSSDHVLSLTGGFPTS